MGYRVGLMLIGYTRASARDPKDGETQRRQLTKLGAQVVLIDVGISGPAAALSRAYLDEALGECAAGDGLLVTSLARLARSTQDLVAVLEELRIRGTDLVVGRKLVSLVAQGYTLADAVGLTARFERELAALRAEDTWRQTTDKGSRRPGRKPKLDSGEEQMMVRLFQSGARTVDELAERYRVGRSTVYRIIERAESPTPDGTRYDVREEASRNAND